MRERVKYEDMSAQQQLIVICSGECAKNYLITQGVDFEAMNSARTRCDYKGCCGRVYRVTSSSAARSTGMADQTKGEKR